MVGNKLFILEFFGFLFEYNYSLVGNILIYAKKSAKVNNIEHML